MLLGWSRYSPPQRSRREFRRQGRRQRHPCVNIAHASSSTLAALPPRLANIQMPVFEHLFDSKVAQAFLTHSTVMEGVLLEPKITGYQTQRVWFPYFFLFSLKTLLKSHTLPESCFQILSSRWSLTSAWSEAWRSRNRLDASFCQPWITSLDRNTFVDTLDTFSRFIVFNNVSTKGFYIDFA